MEPQHCAAQLQKMLAGLHLRSAQSEPAGNRTLHLLGCVLLDTTVQKRSKVFDLGEHYLVTLVHASEKYL